MAAIQGFYYYSHTSKTTYQYVQTNGEVPLFTGYVSAPSTQQVSGVTYINIQNGHIILNGNTIANLINPSIVQDINANGAYYYATLEGQFFNLQPIASLVYELGEAPNPYVSSLLSFYYSYTVGSKTIDEYIRTNGEIPVISGYLTSPNTILTPGVLYVDPVDGITLEIDSQGNSFMVSTLNNPSIIQDTNTNSFYYATLQNGLFNLQPINSVVYQQAGSISPQTKISLLTCQAYENNQIIQVAQVGSNATISFHPSQNYVSGASIEGGYFDFSVLPPGNQTIVLITSDSGIYDHLTDFILLNFNLKD